ncbi:MAG: glucuronate isomerase, partial [Planctomycetia bacterium]
FDKSTSLYQYRALFNEKSRVVFPISVLTSNQNQELVAYSWIFPNVVASGHWWYSNIPSYIEADARARLEAVPSTKIVGYYSDAYKLEFVLPKFNMYRQCLARVLGTEFVVARGWSEEKALGLAKTVLRDNVERIFPLRTDRVAKPSKAGGA